MTDRVAHAPQFRTLASLRPPRVARAVVRMVLVGIAVAIGVMVFVPWVQTARGQGQVVALDPDDRVRDVSSLVAGRVDRFFVTDGQQVRRGDPIVRIVDLDPALLSRLAAERAQLEAQIAAIRRERSVAGLDVGRTRQLYSEGLASRRDYEQTQIRVADAGARLAQAQANLNQVLIQQQRQSPQLVRAPRDGRVQRLNAAAGGALVSAGTVLAAIAPERIERAVEVYIDGRDVPLVHGGRRVRLEFEGFPAIQFSGWPAFAQGIFDGRVRTIDPTAQPNGLFRVLVEPLPGAAPWPDRRFIRQGSRVMGWIQGSTVSVGYELWRQLNDFPLDFGRGPAATTATDGQGTTATGSGAGAEQQAR